MFGKPTWTPTGGSLDYRTNESDLPAVGPWGLEDLKLRVLGPRAGRRSILAKRQRVGYCRQMIMETDMSAGLGALFI